MKKRLEAGSIKAALTKRGYVVENAFRHYAVLIPMICTEKGVSLLYEVRGKELDRQPGEICFPGGEVEDGEDYGDCALREAEEEIGLYAEDVELLDEMTTIYGVGRFAMHCFPAFVDAKAMDGLSLNEEVD